MATDQARGGLRCTLYNSGSPSTSTIQKFEVDQAIETRIQLLYMRPKPSQGPSQ